MKLGDKVYFINELKRKVNTSTKESLEYAMIKGYITVFELEERLKLPYNHPATNWGIFSNEKTMEGIVVGKRQIDMTGSVDLMEGWYPGEKLSVYLVATNMTGFHRVPEEFILDEVYTGFTYVKELG